MNHNLPGSTPEPGTRNQWIAMSLVFAAIGTICSAMQHFFGWTIVGVLLVGLDIFLLTGRKK